MSVVAGFGKEKLRLFFCGPLPHGLPRLGIDFLLFLGHPHSAFMDFVVFDLETTGLSPYSEEIIQIAAVRMNRGVVLESESFATYVNPGRRISSFITSYTGITNQHVMAAPDPVEALARFFGLRGGCHPGGSQWTAF